VSSAESPGQSHATALLESPGFLTRIGWPMFMAASWTWGIGMYLPVLLYDLYGWIGVLAFAVPNLTGIAILGWVLGSRERVASLRTGHRKALGWFSLITIWFHIYFLAWVFTTEVGPLSALFAAPLALLLLAIAWFCSGLSERTFLRWGMLTWLASLSLLIFVLGQWSGAEWKTQRVPTWTGADAWGGLQLAPILALGFLTCPAFDLTLQRAFLRMVSAADASAARRGCVLFSGYFAVMIVFTCVYALTGFRPAVVVHVFVQSLFTVAAHVRELDEIGWPVGGTARLAQAKWLGGGALAVVLVAVLPLGEYHYLWWLGFYGILFPAYGLMKIVPRRFGDAEADWVLYGCSAAIGLLLLAQGVYGRVEWLSMVPALLLFLWSAPYISAARRRPQPARSEPSAGAAA